MPILDEDIHEDTEFENTYTETEVTEEEFNTKKASLYKKSSGIDVSKVTTRVTLRYYNNDEIVDKETIPLVKDGVSLGQIKEYYIRTSTADTPSKSASWSYNSIPAFDGTNKYLWNYEEEYNTRGELFVSTEPQLLSANGKEISSLTEYYQRTSSTVVPPYTDLTDWSTTPPDTTEGKYLWNLEYIVYPDGTTAKTAPQIISANGEDGETILTLVIYIRASSSPTVPTSSSYNLTTDTLTGIGAWSRAIPTDDGYACWQAVANIATTLDSVSVAWNTPTKILDSSLAVAKYTPRYLGARTSAPSGVNTGDYYLQLTYSSGTYTDAKLVKWNGTAWEEVGAYSTATASYYNGALDDVLTYADVGSTMAVYSSAFITHIFAKYIKATGSIRVGNRYTETGGIASSTAKGAYLGSDGVLKAYGAEIDGNGTFTGTVKATSGSFTNGTFKSVTIDEGSTFNGLINANKGIFLSKHKSGSFSNPTGSTLWNAMKIDDYATGNNFLIIGKFHLNLSDSVGRSASIDADFFAVYGNQTSSTLTICVAHGQTDFILTITDSSAAVSIGNYTLTKINYNFSC